MIKKIHKSIILNKKATICKFTNCHHWRLALTHSCKTNAAKQDLAAKFRQWAPDVLKKEYILKGFVMDDGRLKNTGQSVDGYFDELLQRIQDIRTSVSRLYQKIADIHTLSIEYDPNHDLTREFFQTVQKKIHWAIFGAWITSLLSYKLSRKKH
jgi:hypothetical protein